MKIYSSFKDYYDHPPHLADDTVSYIREPKEFQKHHLRNSQVFEPSNQTRFDAPENGVSGMRYTRSEYNGERMDGIAACVLYVSGKRYLGFRILMYTGSDKWVWDHQQIVDAITQVYPPYKDTILKWYTENQSTESEYDLHVETNSPIILYSLSDQSILHLNPSLKSIGFSLIDSYHAHLAIEACVRDYLTTPTQTTPLTDTQKIIGHGIDVKTSFRKSKQC